jgi:hypothetical protein
VEIDGKRGAHDMGVEVTGATDDQTEFAILRLVGLNDCML